MKIFLLIVGAGPVGLTLAAECVRYGVPFRIIDQKKGLSHHSKALLIWSGTLEHLATLDLARVFLETARPIRMIRFEDMGRQIAEIPLNEGLESLYPVPIILPQNRTESLLLNYLEEHGFHVEWGKECRKIRPHPQGVICDIQNSDGSTETIESEWLAGCDGARSIVRHHLPVTFPGITEKVGFILADVRAIGDLASDSILVSSGSGGNVILFPVEPGIWRIFAMRSTDDTSDPTLAEIQHHLKSAGLERIRISDPTWLSHFIPNERVVSKNRVGRVFLLGDASHVHSPAGGQGMNTGMQDAFNLGWKLQLLMSGIRNVESLAESYFLERHPVAEKVVRETTRLLHFGILNQSMVRTARRMILPLLSRLGGVRKKLAYGLSEIGISYSSSPLIADDVPAFRHQKDLRPGMRARPVEVFKNGQPISLWNELLHGAHSLLIFEGLSPQMESSEELMSGLEVLPTAVRRIAIGNSNSFLLEKEEFTVLLDPHGLAHRRYGAKELCWYFIRPDQYITARGVSSDWDILRSTLSKIS